MSIYSNLQIDLLQEYIFISLDIFKNHIQNKGISRNNELEAWLTFLSIDDPEWILKLIEMYPRFKKIYLEIYEACQNTEVFMGIFSKELIEMDQNTVDFMIDEMQDTIDAQKLELDAQKLELDAQKLELDAQKLLLDEKDKLIAELQKQLSKK